MCTARAAPRRIRELQQVELVWTDPLAVGVSLRRTDQALLPVINSAQPAIRSISFAVDKIPAIAAAIVQAATRGVALRIGVEAPEPSGQNMELATLIRSRPAPETVAAQFEHMIADGILQRSP